ncbi:hypothetical protein [Thermacetogenium phaeum]|uniref:hypothetical protein n=1 Tax=Thermacetogenium phaeum TaxID=85874 RepID=UPI0011D1E96F|nr:hypothetical protein [Thermacetogenium phaeum]
MTSTGSTSAGTSYVSDDRSVAAAERSVQCYVLSGAVGIGLQTPEPLEVGFIYLQRVGLNLDASTTGALTVTGTGALLPPKVTVISAFPLETPFDLAGFGDQCDGSAAGPVAG